MVQATTYLENQRFIPAYVSLKCSGLLVVWFLSTSIFRRRLGSKMHKAGYQDIKVDWNSGFAIESTFRYASFCPMGKKMKRRLARNASFWPHAGPASVCSYATALRRHNVVNSCKAQSSSNAFRSTAAVYARPAAKAPSMDVSRAFKYQQQFQSATAFQCPRLGSQSKQTCVFFPCMFDLEELPKQINKQTPCLPSQMPFWEWLSACSKEGKVLSSVMPPVSIDKSCKEDHHFSLPAWFPTGLSPSLPTVKQQLREWIFIKKFGQDFCGHTHSMLLKDFPLPSG